jgi:hypothetical protein
MENSFLILYVFGYPIWTMYRNMLVFFVKIALRKKFQKIIEFAPQKFKILRKTKGYFLTT